MIISTLWITRKGIETESPELITAWDEYSIDENYDGWQLATQLALKEIGDDVVDHRFIDIKVPDEKIFNLFDVATVATTEIVLGEDTAADG